MKRNKRELTDFGLWVKIRILQKNITLTELATRVGTNKQFLSQMIHGEKPGKKYKSKIIKELGGYYASNEDNDDDIAVAVNG